MEKGGRERKQGKRKGGSSKLTLLWVGSLSIRFLVFIGIERGWGGPREVGLTSELTSHRVLRAVSSGRLKQDDQLEHFFKHPWLACPPHNHKTLDFMTILLLLT